MRMHDAKTIGRVAAAVITTVALVGPGGANAAVRATVNLHATPRAPRASGRAKLVLQSPKKARFVVAARGLPRNGSFDVVVKQVKVATLRTSGGGSGRVQLGTSPHGRTGVLGLDPSGLQVEVRDDAGEDVLVGDMPDSGDPGAVACCVPHDGETECEDLTPAACTSAGGTATTATSCLPDPCSTAPPSPGVVCCIVDSAEGAILDDDPSIECEQTTEAACAASSGVVVGAPSCSPNPCAPVPPPQVAPCCVPDHDGAECEELTPDHCTTAGGTASTATSCHPDPCGGSSDDDGSHPAPPGSTPGTDSGSGD